jgi:PAS domain S-box-containing protein
LYSFTDRKTLDGVEILKSAARSHKSSPVNFRIEYLESQHFGTSIPVIYSPPAVVHVDWRQLRRWGIPEPALPAGAILLYRQPTTWERYEKYVGVGLLLIVVQAMLIIGLLWQRARNRKADLRLRESEKRFRLMADTTPALIWMCDRQGTVTYLNDRRIEFTGRDMATGFGDVWSTFIHPDDVQSVIAANKRALEEQKGYSREYRLRRHDGVYRWMLDVAAPRLNGSGSFAGFVGSAVDITDQKMAQEALEKIGGKLIEAQEEERSRIARELHDDICQRLALLSMELEQANRESNGSSRSLKLDEIRRHCAQIAGDVQALSHKLHSSKLEYLGLAAAVRSLCREFSQQHDVNVQFADENVPGFLPRDISLSLFRVTQEALQNALKHSGVRQFSVSLRCLPNEIQLEVSDHGMGFDLERARLERGMGLVSMEERVHLVHGIFIIESAVNSGTKILVRVPLAAETKASTTIAESA